ncbi:MAG: periplasmic heavy metal sensor [Emcibacter sp.]|nr:periplasmic heavy metal sensor [Emcibacter sp.]
MIMYKRIIFFTLFLLLIIGCGFFIGDYFQRDTETHEGHSHQNLHQMLNLTPAQYSDLRPIEKKFAEQKSLYESQIHLANMELGDVMRQEKAYTPKVQAAVKKIHVAMGHLQEVTLVHFFEMRAILDEEQAHILDDYAADAMHEH